MSEFVLTEAAGALDAALLHESVEDLYENAPCGYLSLLTDGALVKVNQTFLDWSGFTRDDLRNKRFTDLLTVGGRIFYETHCRPLLLMQGQLREIALDMVHKKGSVLPVLLSAAVKYDEFGEPAIVRTTVFDASHRRQYERELVLAKENAEIAEANARSLARTLQESLIPPSPPTIPGLNVGAAYRPAGHGDEVGGDFYDIFETAPGHWGVALGDVQGKGVSAATVTALARYTIRAAAITTDQPSSVLQLLNAALLRDNTDRFCTAVFARIALDPNGVQIVVSIGGHPQPIRVAAGGKVHTSGEQGDLLGVAENARLHDSIIDLSPGDAVVFYTDGVTEARAGNEFFGEEGLVASLARSKDKPANEIAESIVGDILAFSDGLPRDDIAIVVLKAPAQVSQSRLCHVAKRHRLD